jgi:hypothetical protein
VGGPCELAECAAVGRVGQAAAAGSGLPPGEEAAAEAGALREECALLRARADNNPEVARFAGAATLGPRTRTAAQCGGVNPVCSY